MRVFLRVYDTVVQVQHGHKIKSLGAILNFKQFCVKGGSKGFLGARARAICTRVS